MEDIVASVAIIRPGPISGNMGELILPPDVNLSRKDLDEFGLTDVTVFEDVYMMYGPPLKQAPCWLRGSCKGGVRGESVPAREIARYG